MLFAFGEISAKATDWVFIVLLYILIKFGKNRTTTLYSYHTYAW